MLVAPSSWPASVPRVAGWRMWRRIAGTSGGRVGGLPALSRRVGSGASPQDRVPRSGPRKDGTGL